MHLAPEAVSGVDPFARRLTVLHVLQPTEAGVWRYAHDMAAYQAELGWDVHVASGRPVTSPVHWHPWHSVRHPARGIRAERAALLDAVTQVQPDVIVAHSAKAGLVVRLSIQGRIPTVFLPHAWSFSALRGPMRMAALGWERYAARYANAIVGVGSGEITRGISHGILAPYFLVPNPVPRDWLSDRPGPGAPPKAADVVCVARLTRQKGVDVLLAAWPRVRDAIPDATLAVIGDGPEREQLESAIPSGVTFLGHQENPAAFVAAAKVVALPSRWEGMSLAMLEAMASGRSLVATDVDGAEVVRAAHAGAVVPTEDASGLADALIERLRRPELAQREGAAGAAYVAQHHDFETAARRLAAVVSRAHVFGRQSSSGSSTWGAGTPFGRSEQPAER